MHPDEAGLVEAIRAAPYDHALRLVYADWLEDHGQPERAEHVRLNVEFRSTLTFQRREENSSRRSELEAAHLGTWLAPLQPFDPDKVKVGFDGVGPASITITGGAEADLDILRHAPSVSRLRLDGCQLMPDALRLVAGLRHLDGLTIANTSIDLAWLELLDGLPPWTAVRINEEGYSEEEWAAFQQRRMGRVTCLEPDQRRKAAIRFLYGLNGHVLTDGTKAYLSQERVTDAELRFLSWLPDLDEVDLYEGRNVTTAGLAHLSGARRLRSLYIGGTEIDSLAPIADCTALERLEFHPDHDGIFTDTGTTGLERLTNLEWLSLRFDELADETVKRIGSLVRLKEMHLEVGPLNDPGCLAALARLRSLEKLWLSGDSEHSDHVLRHLAGLGNLKTLSMSISGDGDSLRHLRGLTRLRRLYLDGGEVGDTCILHLAALSCLRTIMAQHSALTVAAARELAARLPEVTIILREEVVKSPRPTLSFRRRSVGGFASALFPSHWSDRGQTSERQIELVEDGWEAVGCGSNGVVGPAGIRLSFSTGIPAGGVAGFRDQCVNSNSHMGPRVLNWAVFPLEGAEDEASCIYRCGTVQYFLCVAAVAGRLVVFQCHAPPSRFDEFLPLFRFVAASVRIGGHAHSAEEVVVAPSELA